MRDQADRLRQVVDNLKFRQAEAAGSMNARAKKKTARMITITSDKGGVGKTNVTVNLAIALSELGLKVIILDADFGLANIDVLFGIVPRFTLVDVMDGKKNILETLSDGPNNIKFISGGSGVEGLVKLDRGQLERFINNISLLDKICDVVIIDTGAGLSDNVMSFVLAADEVLVITTPEPTSITDAYALIKMISVRDREKLIKVIVNRAENVDEGENILGKLSMVAERFLKINIYPLGFILRDDSVIKAVKQQQPFALVYPKSQAAKHVREIAKKLVADQQGSRNEAADSGVKSFINRLVSFMRT